MPRGYGHYRRIIGYGVTTGGEHCTGNTHSSHLTVRADHDKARSRLHQRHFRQFIGQTLLGRVRHRTNHLLHRFSEHLTRNNRTRIAHMGTIIMTSSKGVIQRNRSITFRLRRRQRHSTIFLTNSHNQRVIRTRRLHRSFTSIILTFINSRRTQFSTINLTTHRRQFRASLRTRIRHRFTINTGMNSIAITRHRGVTYNGLKSLLIISTRNHTRATLFQRAQISTSS